MFIVGTLLATLACGPRQSYQDSAVQDFQNHNISAFGLAGTRTLALTFDDGPSPVTRRLLDILEDKGVAATFFVLGDHAHTRRAIIERIHNAGHVIANHGKTHGDLRRMELAAAVAEIKYTHGEIRDLTDGRRLYFRAPYGAWSTQLAPELNSDLELRDYIGPIFWTAGGETTYDSNGEIRTAADWECWSHHRSEEECMRGYTREVAVHQGGVVLMHDLTTHSVEMAGKLIDQWRTEGYRFVTLDEIRSLDRYAHRNL
jgi:peptidoglycan/xylan/chitin deacetylase (PgdA/CDA1 family)